MTSRYRLQARMTALVVALLVGALAQSGAAWAFWTASTVTPGSGAAATLTSVRRANTPAATVDSKNVVPLSWAASTLADGTPVTSYTVQRYSTTDEAQPVLAGCTGKVTATSCTETGVPDGLWSYAVTPRFASSWTGPQSPRSVQVRTDATAPSNTLTRTPTSGGSFLDGTALYYRGLAGGSFTLTSTVADAGSGPASARTSLTATGWSHTGSTVTTPAAGPYVSDAVSWAAGTTSAAVLAVTARDRYSNALTTDVNLINDSTAPTGGTISHLSGPQTLTTLPVTLGATSDTGSGIASRALQESTAILDGDTCGAFSAYTTVSTTGSSSSRTVTNGTCHRYQYRLTDNVGNVAIVAGPDPVEVRNYGAIVANTTGIQSHWRLGQPAGSTTAASTPTANTATCVGGVVFGTAGAIVGDTNTAVTFDGVNDYCQVARSISTTFSIELWFRSTQGIGTATTTNWFEGAGLVDAEMAGTTNDFGISLSNDGRVMAGTGDPDTTIASTGGLNNGVWHHVVLTRSSSTGVIQLYVDGTLRASSTGSVAALTAPTAVRFGSVQTGRNFYAGRLDEVATYTSVLPAATILNHYQSGLP